MMWDWRRVAIAALVLLVLGFLAGRASVPEVDLTRSDSLTVTKPAHDALRDSTRRFADSAVAAGRADSIENARLARVAASARAAGQRAVEVAGVLAQQLDSARSAADSVPVLVAVNVLLSQAVDSLGAAADSFSVAYQREQQVSATYRLALVAQGEQIARDSVRLEVYQSIVDGLRKAAKGCRVPLTKLRCPMVTGTADISGGALVSAVYPVSSLVAVGVSYRVLK
jgi:hypothetical protein